jgi:long-chain acyl-CoA synthetase
MVNAAAAAYDARPWTQYYDDGVPARLNYPQVPLHQFLRDTAKRVPNSPALISSAKLPVLGRQASAMTYAQLENASDAMAAALVDLGLKKGDSVAIVMPNCAAFAICFFAVLKAGGIVSAANPTYPPDKMQYQLNDCNAKIVITLTLFYDMLKKLQPQTQIKHVIVANIKEYLTPIARTLFTIAREKKDGHFLAAVQSNDFWFQDVLKKYQGQKANVDVKPDDIALFQYTGGTTGVSKAAVSLHKSLVANMFQMDAIMSVFNVPGEKEIILGAIPMFHVYGLVVALSLAVYKGGRIVLIPNARDIDEVVSCIEHFKPTLFPGVPALYNAINNHARVKSGEADLKSLRYCISGSAPLPSVTKEEFERLSGAKVREGFGMSEIPTATHVNPIYKENRLNSIGLPLPDVECRIISLDDGETELPVGEIGELIIHAPNLMLGYHGMPTETANVLREKDGKKWMYTGDIARMDEAGYFYIVDRKKDMALIGGFNVYPTNIENILKSHPAVLEVGVAAVSHPDRPGQEALKAWVVKKPDMDVTEKELIDYCSQKLAPYEVPRRIAFIKELPKSAVGKTLRRELIQMELDSLNK